jgi:hypothetical protein
MSGSGRERRQRGGPFKRPVDGGPADAEQGGDLGDVVVAAVVHAADLAVLRGPEGGWNETDGGRRSMLLDIATEELSHLEMVAQTLSLLLKGSPSELVDQVEGNYLGELLDGNIPHPDLPDDPRGGPPEDVQAALDAITDNFPPGTLEGDPELGHAYVADSGNFGGGRGGAETDGFKLAQANSQWGFELNDKPVGNASTQKVQ